MNFIKKIFGGDIDESVHLQFQKFSKGEFRNKAIIEAKNSNGKYTIKTSAEFANEMVRTVAEKLGDEKANVKGVIISTTDLKDKLDFQDKKQFQGIKKYIINKEISGNDIIELINKLPKAFFALSFEAGNNKLKIKPKSPKSGKPGKNGESPKPDFCSLKTDDTELGRSFIFEKPNFKKAEIVHHFIINELILPKGETDYSKVREVAKRKGKIIRNAVIDEEKIESEKEFEA